MDLVDYEVAYAWARTFISDEFIELIRGSRLGTEQHNFVFSCLCLHPDITVFACADTPFLCKLETWK
jgi:hypothetical protein